jgi:chemotaxis response regulator CheB
MPTGHDRKLGYLCLMTPWAQHQEDGHLVIALITSAGGLDALTDILAQLPADLPARSAAAPSP